MTAKEARDNQDRIAKQYDLGWWYGTRCQKCCGVYPKLMMTNDMLKCFYQCEVCGTRTEPALMPWIAEEAWNNGKVEYGQMDIFAFIEGGQYGRSGVNDCEE